MAKICPKGIAWAKRTFDKYPSAYANMAASKYCKDPNYAKGSKRKKLRNKKNPDRCLPMAKARSLSKAQRAATARKKKKAGAKGKQFVANTRPARVSLKIKRT